MLGFYCEKKLWYEDKHGTYKSKQYKSQVILHYVYRRDFISEFRENTEQTFTGDVHKF